MAGRYIDCLFHSLCVLLVHGSLIATGHPRGLGADGEVERHTVGPLRPL
jgi:hypothetical protein